jgi:hypothetical protein
MKYFTPELLLAYGADAPNVWKDAEAQWDDACSRYEAYLATVKASFTPGLKQLEGHLLHDAKVRSMGSRDDSFVFVLQLDTPPRQLLTLTYDLMEPASINPEALPAELRSSSEVPEWQYDEVEMGPGSEPKWRQSILLSNGWEVRLFFRDVRVEELRPLIPAPPGGIVAGPVEAAGTA